jgi:hypothetical protein
MKLKASESIVTVPLAQVEVQLLVPLESFRRRLLVQPCQVHRLPPALLYFAQAAFNSVRSSLSTAAGRSGSSS